jgi:demethylmenaquinone methyltransferase/2-methoxy-6-polyprenyl-1,4-benzoquinol methylase
VPADAARLPFEDDAFDTIGIAFAFRNLVYRNPHRDAHLAEIRRVLAPRGTLVIVESSQPANPLVRAISHAYTGAIVPIASRILSGHRGAYRYLASSVIRFDPPEGIASLLRSSGFRDVTFRRLLFGAAALHVATGSTRTS